MQQFKGTQITSAVIGNREQSSHFFRTTAPAAIVSSCRGAQLRSGETKRTGEQGEKREFAQRRRLPANLPLFSPDAVATLLGEFDWQLSVCQSIIWFISHKRRLGALLLISLSFRGMKIHSPPSRADTSLSLPTRPEDKWKSSKWNTQKRKDNQSKYGESAPGIVTRPAECVP